MVLGRKDGENTVIKEILRRLAELENKVKIIESENAAQKEEISKLKNNLNNSNISINNKKHTEWSDIVMGNNKKLTENQINILNVVGSEQKERQSRKYNVILLGVPESNATTDEERTKEDEATTFEILEEIGMEKESLKTYVYKVKRFRSSSKNTTASKPLPIRVTFYEDDNIVIDTLKKAKKLKDSLKFKNVFFNKDLTASQIVQLKQLIKTRNDENAKLDKLCKETSTKVPYRYGIRNDKVVKMQSVDKPFEITGFYKFHQFSQKRNS